WKRPMVPSDRRLDRLSGHPHLARWRLRAHGASAGRVFLQGGLRSPEHGGGVQDHSVRLLCQLDGATKLQPLVREGILSLIPDAPFDTALRKPGTVYLGEVHVFGGNSGSHVFISLDGVRPR